MFPTRSGDLPPIAWRGARGGDDVFPSQGYEWQAEGVRPYPAGIAGGTFGAGGLTQAGAFGVASA